MNILDQIIGQKKKEVETNRLRVPSGVLERSPLMERNTISLTASLQLPGMHGIIAEIKRMSPSRGLLNGLTPIDQIATGYVRAGASALSVLTDGLYFGGSAEDIRKVRELVEVPILRKDFIIDDYQVIEAKAIGADAILLIAGVMPVRHLQSLAALAHELSLEVLFEIHNAEGIEAAEEVGVDLLGVNNRNLADLSVSVDASRALASRLPSQLPSVSESGIENPGVIRELRQLGYSGFLIGSYFMQHEAPERACDHFIQQLR